MFLNVFWGNTAPPETKPVLDRLNCYLPGWEVNPIREKMFSKNYGLVVDYLAEFLRSMRNRDYSDCYTKYFSLPSDIPIRDLDSIKKTCSGLKKILFPHGVATKEEIKELLEFAIEGRKRVKDHLMRIDATIPKATFTYQDLISGKVKSVSTLEEGKSFHARLNMAANGTDIRDNLSIATFKQPLREWSNIHFQNERNVSFDSMFGPYLRCASNVNVTDPYNDT